jgi:nicotinamidase-related amidase
LDFKLFFDMGGNETHQMSPHQTDPPVEKPALLIIDMAKDSFDPAKHLPITPLAEKILRPINRMIRIFREHQWPLVFTTDAYHADDFIFKGRMKPHSLAGTEGAQVIDDLDQRAEDLWLPKPRFSAFFDTDLAQWLKDRAVTLCVLAGIATNFCVLATALDALCHDFKVVLLEDCSAAASQDIHKHTLDIYRRNPLNPLFSIQTSVQLAKELVKGT